MKRTHYQCLECGGTYFDHQRDGAPYFHTCSSVVHYDAPAAAIDGEDMRLHAPRAIRRDENLPDVERDDGENVKRRGRGRREVPEGSQPLLPPRPDRPPLEAEEHDG